MAEFTLRQLEFFVAVVDAGSVTAAARHLHVSPGGVSLALTELEGSLKVQLTLRTRGRGVTVTPAGRWVYQHARDVLNRSADIHSVAQVSRGQLAGPLRIGCFTTLSPWLIPRIIAYFAEHHPQINVHLHEDASTKLHDQLREGELDAILIYSSHVTPWMTSEEIGPVRLQLAISPAHRLAAWEQVPLQELENETAILLNLQAPAHYVEEVLLRAGFEPKVRWRSNNVETIRAMVARGLGYTLIMGRPYGDRTYDGLPLTYRPIADPLPATSVVLAYPKGATPTAKVRKLATFCKHEFGRGGPFAAMTQFP